MIHIRLFLLRDDDFIHGALSDLKLRAVLHTAWKLVSKNP